MSQQYDVVTESENRRGRGGRVRLPLRWDTSTAVATIVVVSALTISALRGSLKGGAIQP